MKRRAQARPRRSRARGPGAARRLLRPGRIGAAIGAAIAGAGLIWLVYGPALRVERFELAGNRYTDSATVLAAVEGVSGESLLAVNTDRLGERLSGLPTVAAARVEARLDGVLAVSIDERTPALVWVTGGLRFVIDAEGALLSALDAGSPPESVGLPVVADRRGGSRYLVVGDRLEPELVATALQLLELDPVALGSMAAALGVELDDEHGFVLTSPGWRAALGLVGRRSPDAAATPELIERRVAAIRTLFAARPEDQVSWVDARNPGKVYWRPKG